VGIRLSFVRRRLSCIAPRGLSFARVATDLGVSIATLKAWVKQAEIDAGEREGLPSVEREELVALRRENRVLREEREILKKAAAFFVKESETR
jgi:transposase